MIRATDSPSDRQFYTDQMESLAKRRQLVPGEIIKSSARYVFLRHLKQDLPDFSESFFIVELERRGEVNISYKFVLDCIDTTHSLLYGFKENNGKWEKIFSKDVKLHINKDLNQQHIKRFQGINRDEIIATYFEKGKAVSAEYFRDRTISGNSFLIELIANYFPSYSKK